MALSDKKVLILKKRNEECPQCKNLEMFMDLALGGAYNDDVDIVRNYEQEQRYNEICEQLNIMSMPAIIDVETGKLIASGFDAGITISFLKEKFGEK